MTERIKRHLIAAVTAVFLLGVHESASAQTCSCAGVPILGAMESASPSSEQWFVSGTFEYHDLGELVSGSSTVPNESGRDRTSEALIFEVSRGLTEKLSVTALMAAVSHERDVGGQRDTARGIGDALAMIKYSHRTISLYDKTSLVFGLGAQLPIGEDDATGQGTVLAEDLQPSTGAFAGVAWIYAARALNESRSARIYANATHTHKGENDRNYQFGHATTVGIGGSYQTQTPWGVGLEVLYRQIKRDKRSGVSIPNTGGNWLEVIPAVQYQVNESLAIKASIKIPAARDLNDQLQFTTKYAVKLSVSYVFETD